LVDGEEGKIRCCREKASHASDRDAVEKRKKERVKMKLTEWWQSDWRDWGDGGENEEVDIDCLNRRSGYARYQGSLLQKIFLTPRPTIGWFDMKMIVKNSGGGEKKPETMVLLMMIIFGQT
jgi:hypothetical protein